jgi:hypothetical protein
LHEDAIVPDRDTAVDVLRSIIDEPIGSANASFAAVTYIIPFTTTGVFSRRFEFCA